MNWWTFLTDGLKWCGLLWCFYQLFGLSFWRHPFTAEHPLLRQWDTDEVLQIWWRKKLIYISDGLRESKYLANVHFWVNYSFKYTSEVNHSWNSISEGTWVQKQLILSIIQQQFHFYVYTNTHFKLVICILLRLHCAKLPKQQHWH